MPFLPPFFACFVTQARPDDLSNMVLQGFGEFVNNSSECKQMRVQIRASSLFVARMDIWPAMFLPHAIFDGVEGATSRFGTFHGTQHVRLYCMTDAFAGGYAVLTENVCRRWLRRQHVGHRPDVCGDDLQEEGPYPPLT